VRQCILPFKLETTTERITPHSGLSLFGEFIHAMNLPNQLNRALPAPGSGAGYQASQFVEPLLLMLHGGGRTLEDLRQISTDVGLRDLLKLDKIPSTCALGDWLRRMGASSGLAGLAAVNRLQICRALKRDETSGYTLDIDATQIIAEKEEAKRTYKGERGYMPMVGHLAENGLVLADEFREGNDSPCARHLEFIKYCEAQMPKGLTIQQLRADSASYQADLFNWCEDKKIKFAIGGDLDVAVKTLIAGISEGAWRSFEDGQITEVIHSMNNTEKAFRLIVLRRPTQGQLFTSGEKAMRHTVIASNREECAEETVSWYRRRGDTSENRIKDLKIGFGMERMPCGDFAANAVFFRIGVLAYNLFVLFKILALPKQWGRYQIQTVRWRLYQVGGKVVSHARALILKIGKGFFALFEAIRTRTLEMASP